MRFTNSEQIEKFLAAVDSCTHDVYLRSLYGDVYNLKSRLSQYLGVAALLSEHGDELELWCSNKDDEARMLNFLTRNPEITEVNLG